MNDILKKIQALVVSGDVRISEHSYDAMLDDGLYAREIVAWRQSQRPRKQGQTPARFSLPL